MTSSVRESCLAERLFCPRRNVLSEAFAESREEGYRQDEADALVGRRLQKRAGTQQYQEGKQPVVGASFALSPFLSWRDPRELRRAIC
jgi:hypothetical protein